MVVDAHHTFSTESSTMVSTEDPPHSTPLHTEGRRASPTKLDVLQYPSLMAGERTPIFPAARTAHPWRRVALAVVGVVALVTLAIVAFRVSSKATTPANNGSSIEAPASSFTPTVTFPADATGHRELLPYCEEKFVTQKLNQFEAGERSGTYEQRYFICGKQFFNKDNGTIFFYNGNEADVLLYLNNTGLMWENAEEFNALMVFAEHRYFGKSIPFGDEVLQHMEYLSPTAALADFAVLIETLKEELAVDVPVIGFGGSYGGMLSAWFRMKYPHLMDGAIAASAPLLHYYNDPDHVIDTEAFRRIVSFDMTEAAGSSPNCAANARKASAAITRLSETPEGRKTIIESLNVCNPDGFQTRADIDTLVLAIVDTFGNLAMGSYPYPSSYITGGSTGTPTNLPAYPMRVACEKMAPAFADDDDVSVLGAMGDALAVYFNVTGTAECSFPPSDELDWNQTQANVGNIWRYLICTEIYMPLSGDGVLDVFPPLVLNVTNDISNCKKTWGVDLNPDWAAIQYGGLKAIRASSNIVFSNGKYDPWSGSGVLETLSESVVAVVIEGVGHHIDLFFSHPLDTPAVTEARETEKKHMRKWVKAFYERKAKRDVH